MLYIGYVVIVQRWYLILLSRNRFSIYDM